MEAYEAMWSRIEANTLNYRESFWLYKVDGVSVSCNLSTRRSGLFLVIESDWTGGSIYEAKFRSATDIKDFVESVVRLRYDKSQDRLVCYASPSLAYDLFMMLPVSDNITTSYEDCSVCLETCKTRTRCGHSLCQICESSLNPKVCPVCGTSYYYDVRFIEEFIENE